MDILKNMKAIIFDLDGTLITFEGLPFDRDALYLSAFHYVDARMHLYLSERQIQYATETLRRYAAYLSAREREYSSVAIFEEAVRSWNIFTDIIPDVIDCFFDFFQQHAKAYPDTGETLKFLKRKAMKIGIFTDVPMGMPARLLPRNCCGFREVIDSWLTSVDCGFRKPNPTGLQKIVDWLGESPRTVAFVGDEEKDIQAAHNAGIMAIWINRHHAPAADFGQQLSITSLIDLKEFFI